jgi:dTDP-4-dehydrorhamnose reductase
MAKREQNMFQQQRILVIGSSGYLGRAITKALTSNHLVFPTHNRNPYFPHSIPYSFPGDDLSQFVIKNRIDTCIFPAEIEKNQNYQELDELDFFHKAVEKLIQSLASVRLVYISSDGIFDGRQGLYTESDVPQPATKYGRKLKICEDVVRSLCANYCIIRPSYLYGHALGTLDSRLQRTKKLCQSQQQAVYFDDMYKSPLHVMDAASLIITLTLSKFIGIVNISGPRMSVYAFHKEAMSVMGISGQIMPNKIPSGASFLRDTSLDVSLCTKLTGFVPQSVAKSFLQHPE